MNDDQLHRHLIDKPGGRESLNTPALVLDLDILTRNIASMAEFCAGMGIKLRPHAKTHKSPDIAKLQLAAGAVGMCCTTLREAEALVENDVLCSVLITSPVVGTPGIDRLISLNARAEGLLVVVDNPANVDAIGEAASRAGRSMTMLIDVDPGFRRTGVATPQDAVSLCKAIARHASLRLAGVQFYCGQEQHIKDFQERRAAVAARVAFARGVIRALEAEGATLNIITGGGTGTHVIDAELGLFTELQAGSYVFMDADYLACDLTGAAAHSLYGVALTVDTRVVSANTPGRVTLDAGVKALSTDAGWPAVLAGAPTAAVYSFMGDEHGALRLDDGRLPGLGGRVTLMTSHCDPTVNLHSTFHVVQGDIVRALWPIIGRGV